MAQAMRGGGVRSGVRAVAGALDEGTRRELQQLHGTDPARWTAATLAARYGVERARVTAVLRLGALRARIEARAEHEAPAAAVADAWRRLGAAGGGLRRRGATATAGAGSTPPPPPPPVEDIAPLALADVPPAEAEAAGDTVGTTETARWARDAIAKGEFETARKSTFAFIEVGKGLSDTSRAVWLRDARTGQLRAPTPTERRRLLDMRAIVE